MVASFESARRGLRDLGQRRGPAVSPALLTAPRCPSRLVTAQHAEQLDGGGSHRPLFSHPSSTCADLAAEDGGGERFVQEGDPRLQHAVLHDGSRCSPTCRHHGRDGARQPLWPARARSARHHHVGEQQVDLLHSNSRYQKAPRQSGVEHAIALTFRSSRSAPARFVLDQQHVSPPLAKLALRLGAVAKLRSRSRHAAGKPETWSRARPRCRRRRCRRSA